MITDVARLAGNARFVPIGDYFHAVLPRQFDVMIHIDETHALAPLDAGAHWTREETPETFPTGV
jgi:hypothetical protein